MEPVLPWCHGDESVTKLQVGFTIVASLPSMTVEPSKGAISERQTFEQWYQVVPSNDPQDVFRANGDYDQLNANFASNLIVESEAVNTVENPTEKRYRKDD